MMEKKVQGLITIYIENDLNMGIKLTVDVVEKIVTHVDLSNIEETPKVRKSRNDCMLLSCHVRVSE